MAVPRFGTLVVVVDRARNLPNRKKIGKQDAYAIIRLGHEVQRTPTDKRAGQVPNWNHEVRFQVPREEENILKISVFNEDSKVPDLIGDCAIDLSDLYKKHEYDNWFDLKYKDKPAGEIYAELTFYYEGPPRPKPKVELTHSQTTSRPQSTDPAGRSLPSIPYTSPAMRPPARQRTMSPTMYHPCELSDSISRMKVSSTPEADESGFTRSPYQPGIRYAETWNGDRQSEHQSPGPGDVRRKSLSSETARPLHHFSQNEMVQPAQTQYQRTYSPGPRRNSYIDSYDRGPPSPRAPTHRYLPSQGSIATDRIDHVASTGYRHTLHHQPSMSHLKQHRHSIDLDDIQYVDPILDPRHGSPHELRGSPSIASPRSDYVGINQSPSPKVRDDQEMARAGHKHDPYEQHHRRDYYSLPPRASYGTHGMIATENHAQAPRSSYLSSSPGRAREQVGSQQILQHNKAASTSAMMPAQRSSFPGNIDRDYRTQRDARKSMDQSMYAYDVSRQRRNTYAVTPAEYAAQNRPLPSAPDAPPSLPAKIPLGLTQEEYDILYGR